MADILRLTKKVSTTQPQSNTGIDLSNPLSKGLSHFWGLNQSGNNSITDSVSGLNGKFGVGIPSTVSGNKWLVTSSGYAVNFNSVGTGTASSINLNLGDATGTGAPKTSGSFTLFARVNFASLSNQSIYSSATGSGSIQLRIDAAGAIGLLKSGVAGVASAAGAVTAGQFYNIAVTYNGATVSFYVNGVSIGQFAFVQTFTLNRQYALGAHYATEIMANGGMIQVFGFYDRVLTNAEAVRLTQNFWQLLKSPSIPQFLTLSSGVVNYTLSGTAGSYSLTGNAATFKVNRLLNGAVGSLAFSGKTSAFRSNHTLLGVIGSYSLTGSAGTLTYTSNAVTNHYTLLGAIGSYSLTGNTSTFRSNRVLSGAIGSHSLTGRTSTFKTNRLLNSTSGSYSYLGTSGTLTYTSNAVTNHYTLLGALGVYTLLGNTATLVKRYTLSGVKGTYTSTGLSGLFKNTHSLQGSIGLYGYTGNQAALTKSRVLFGSKGVYAYTTYPATSKRLYSLQGSIGYYSYLGNIALYGTSVIAPISLSIRVLAMDGNRTISIGGSKVVTTNSVGAANG
jgi:hypothetical protein